ncbi:Calpain-13 [Microtus ochrogaster]|uniref:Calpain-13 n=1 Tax=Microtus ochrogaster TaxID=79684 RepID=A0A8J6GE86_MICOH|nr:Calpain-13 [Microtus ochrogaster]
MIRCPLQYSDDQIIQTYLSASLGQSEERTSDISLEIVMAHNPEPLTETSVVKFKNQDFRSLLDRCLSRGQLFIDDTFPAEASSIGQKLLKGKHLSKLEWKRPQDLSDDPPHFILEGASRFDIQQGRAGDCWFLAALGSLTQNPQCLQKILMDQSYSHQYAGIFRFRFWQCGQWMEVVVDDRLPVIDKNFLFVRPRRGNQEFWPCLMEKAYAKLLGSYSQIHYGYLPDALVDLTGGVVTIVNLHSSPSNLLMAVKTAVKAGSMVACATPKGLTDESEVLENGLVSQHAYTVTGAEQIRYQKGWEEIIRLWNPWGNTEWKGRWRDGSQEWEETLDPRKSQLYENKDNGEFWMSCQDFQENFSCLFICNQIPITLDHGVTPNERWRQMMFKNQVISGNMAGGGHGRDTQYLFGVQEPTDGNNVVVAFTITSQSLKTEEDIFPLQFQVFKFQKFQERLPPAFFSPFRNAAQGIDYVSKCNFTKSFHLSPGTYVVVPLAHRKEVEFLLRIFLKMPDKDRNLNSSFNFRALKGSLLEENESQNSIFYRYVDQGLDIDATQLQKLLNQEFQFLTDFLSGILVGNELLSLMTLRYSDSAGRVSFPSLVCFLIRLETMAKAFRNLSKDGKGVYLTEMEDKLLVATQGTDFLLLGAVPPPVVGLQLNLAFEMESKMPCKRLGRVPS